MNIILLGNYKKDKQESMQRFTLMLYDGLKEKGYSVKIWYPITFFAIFFKSTTSGVGKWFGYIDKWILYPLILKIRFLFFRFIKREIRIHICDHSNAIYLSSLPKYETSITCHDVLAIRGGLGYSDAYCSASKTGQILQKWILKNLVSAQNLAAVSKFTLTQLTELAEPFKKTVSKRDWVVIYNAFNANFKVLNKSETENKIAQAGMPKDKPFILHVGSSLPRKNRSMLVKMLILLEDKWTGNVCFAGQEIDRELQEVISDNNLEDRVFSIVNPNHELLEALYNGCYAFVFPSLSEGFGWPLIEAQACGVPVIASKLDPMPEVSGGAALFADPYIPKEFAEALLKLKDKDLRTEMITRGLNNTSRFDFNYIIESYLHLMNLSD